MLKAQNEMKCLGFEQIFYYSIVIEITVNYKSRGGEWVAPTVNRPHSYMCRLPFQAQISMTIDHADLSLYKHFSFISGQSVNAVYPCNSKKGVFPMDLNF